MVKPAEILKLHSVKPHAEVVLSKLLQRAPFLEVIAVPRSVAAHPQILPDFRLKVTGAKGTWSLLIETRRLGHPREARLAALALQNSLRGLAAPEKGYGILMAPFISEAAARVCEEAGIGYADLAGNARLSFDHVFIEMRSPDNPFRERREARSLFTAKSGRVLRILLTPPLRPWKTTELHQAAGVSLGQVSHVRKVLLEREWAIAGDNGLRLRKPESLARAWQSTYRPGARRKQTGYTLLHGESLDRAVKGALAEAVDGANAVLASFSAARWYAPYARQATYYFYANPEGAEILRRSLALQPAPSGENVVVLEPAEDDVFSGRVEAAPGIWCAGLVQTWLDLTASGERGAEAAEHLMALKLRPAWQEASQ